MKLVARIAGIFVTIAICVAPASGETFFVDVVHGDDANGGGTPTDAWRTITHALAVVPVPVPPEEHSILVAAGTYGPSTGEDFPLVVRPGRHLIGSGCPTGSISTCIDGEGISRTLLRIDSHTGAEIPRPTNLRRLALRGAGTGVLVRGEGGEVLATLEGLDIRGMAAAAIEVESFAYAVDLTLLGVTCQGSWSGLSATSAGDGAGILILAEECVLSRNRWGAGVSGHVYSYAGLTLRRSRVEHNAESGLAGSASLFGGAYLRLYDCLVAGNGRNGLQAGGTFDGASADFRLERCTVVDNALAGVSAYLNTGRIIGSIVELVDPQATPFGQLDLAHDAFPFVFLTAGPGPPALYERPIPSDPDLIGRTFWMQAFIDSPAAPQGAAWSNPISFVVSR